MFRTAVLSIIRVALAGAMASADLILGTSGSWMVVPLVPY